MDKEQKAFARLKEAEMYSQQLYDGAPIIVTTSGGKDSDICIELAKRGGVKFEVMHNHTTADAPETVRYVKECFKKLEDEGIHCVINYPTYKDQPTSMWDLIPRKLMPPTRLVRYCCSILKEYGGIGRFITTGVRWAESSKRKNGRTTLEYNTKKKENRIFLNDNDDRRQLEHCTVKGKWVVNPIIDWTDDEVWDYIHSEHLTVNPLYECGFSRVGCIGCPLARKKAREFEFSRYPKYKQMYIHAFERMIDVRTERNKGKWTRDVGTTGQDIFDWWMEYKKLPGQISLEESE